MADVVRDKMCLCTSSVSDGEDLILCLRVREGESEVSHTCGARMTHKGTSALVAAFRLHLGFAPETHGSGLYIYIYILYIYIYGVFVFVLSYVFMYTYIHMYADRYIYVYVHACSLWINGVRFH